MIKGVGTVAGIASMGGCLASSDESDVELNFAFVPSGGNIEMTEQWDPVREHVQSETDFEVEFFTASNYSGVVEALNHDQAEIAYVGGFTFDLAREMMEDDPEVIAKMLNPATGEATYKSYITTSHEDVEGLSDMEGMTAAFSDPTSTSGFLIPVAMMLDSGYHPEELFDEQQYVGDHPTGQLHLKNDQVDVATTPEYTYHNMIADGEITEEDSRIVLESDPIPRSPVVVHPDVDDATKEAVRDAFLSIGETDALEESDLVGFESATNSDYQYISDSRTTLDEAGYDVGIDD